MKLSSWQGKEIRGIIRTLGVNCTLTLDSSNDDGKTAADRASDKLVLGAVRALCECSLLVSQQNHSDPSPTALDDTLNSLHMKKVGFWEYQLSKTAKTKLDELLARESHLVREQNIDTICAAIETQVYVAEKVTTIKKRQFPVRLNTAKQVATLCSDADWQSAKEWLEYKIYQVTPGKRKLFDKVFQPHQQQPLLEFGTKVTGPRCAFLKKLAPMKGAADDENYGIANMTADNSVEFELRICNVNTSVPMVPDRDFGSGSGSELNRCQIGHPDCVYNWTISSGTGQW